MDNLWPLGDDWKLQAMSGNLTLVLHDTTTARRPLSHLRLILESKSKMHISFIIADNSFVGGKRFGCTFRTSDSFQRETNTYILDARASKTSLLRSRPWTKEGSLQCTGHGGQIWTCLLTPRGTSPRLTYDIKLEGSCGQIFRYDSFQVFCCKISRHAEVTNPVGYPWPPIRIVSYMRIIRWARLNSP